MKTKTINLYEFHELTEEAQQKALENLWDINVSHEWWDFTYEDAKNVGVKITGFDLDRGQIDLELEGSCGETAEAIMRGHGKDCGTYKKAKLFRPRTDKWKRDTLKRLQSGRNVFEQDRLNKIEALKQLLK